MLNQVIHDLIQTPVIIDLELFKVNVLSFILLPFRITAHFNVGTAIDLRNAELHDLIPDGCRLPCG